MTFEIHSARSRGDLGGLAPLLRAYLRDEVAGTIAEAGVTVDVDTYAAATMEAIDAYLPPRGRLLIARRPSGEAVGMVLMKPVRPDTAEIKRLYVAPAARGSGLGRRMVERLLAEARSVGYTRVLLDSTVHMTGAHALYRALGFVETAPYPESENDATLLPHLVFMERPL